jgi:hypothetical protein
METDMKEFKLHAPDEAYGNNVRTFTPLEDGTVKVWMFIKGDEGDADIDELDEVMSEAAAVKWSDFFKGQGWLVEEAPVNDAPTVEEEGMHHYDDILDRESEFERHYREEDEYESKHN